MRRVLIIGLLCAVAGVSRPQATPAPVAPPQGHITTPVEQFGHNFGDDYFLANYQQISTYWKKLATESNRIVVQSIGKTAEGREQLMAIVTSPANQRNLARVSPPSTSCGN